MIYVLVVRERNIRNVAVNKMEQHDKLLSIATDDAELKKLRCIAHDVFRQWIKLHEFKTNGSAYCSLSMRLDIPKIECHFGRMNKETIIKVIDYMRYELSFNKKRRNIK